MSWLKWCLAHLRLSLAAVVITLVAVGFIPPVNDAIVNWATDGLATPTSLTATAVVLPGAATITNEDNFSWYGLVITVDGEYSNRPLLDLNDPTFLHWGSEEEYPPGDQINFSYTGLVNNDGERFEHTLGKFQPPIDEMVLEAKTEPDGPYNLRGVLTLDERSEPE